MKKILLVDDEQDIVETLKFVLEGEGYTCFCAYNGEDGLKLAKEIGTYGGNFGAILIGANDEAVDLFLHKRIRFVEIERYIIKTLQEAKFIKKPTFEDLVKSHEWAKKHVDDLWANSLI